MAAARSRLTRRMLRYSAVGHEPLSGAQPPDAEGQHPAADDHGGDEEQHREQQPPHVDPADLGAPPDGDAPLAQPAVRDDGGHGQGQLPREAPEPDPAPSRRRARTGCARDDGGHVTAATAERADAGQRGPADRRRSIADAGPSPTTTRRPGPTPTAVPDGSGIASSSTALTPMPTGHARARSAAGPRRRRRSNHSEAAAATSPVPAERGERGDRPVPSPTEVWMARLRRATNGRWDWNRPSRTSAGSCASTGSASSPRRPATIWSTAGVVAPAHHPAPRAMTPTRQSVDQPVDVGDGDVLAQPRLPPTEDPVDRQVVHERGQRRVVDEQDRGRQVELPAAGEEHLGVGAPRSSSTVDPARSR